jgi:hypothetical protein
MATATITYELSTGGQKASILAGGNGQRKQAVTIEPDDPEFVRVVAAGTVASDGHVFLDTYSGNYDCSPQHRAWDHIPTITEILDDLAARRETVRANREAEKTRRREETLAVLRDRVTRSDSVHKDGRYYQVQSPAWPYEAEGEVKASPEAKAWLAELEAANAESMAAQNTERLVKEEQEARVKAERDRKEAERRAKLGLRAGDTDWSIEDGALIECPVYETHKRGKNWAATITVDPAKPGGLGREFWTHAKGESYYMVPALSVGDAVEFGGDYYSGSGRKTADRWYGYVVRIDPETDEEYGRLILCQCSTGKAAVKEGEKYAAKQATGLPISS